MKNAITKTTKTFGLILLMLSVSVILPSISAAQEGSQVNPREKTIYLNTGDKIGWLVYIEQYYIRDSNNNLTVDQTRIYYNGTINNSKMKLLLTRPVDKNGNPYPDNQVRAIATLDSVPILNAWYSSQNSVTSEEVPQVQHPELLIAIIVIITIVGIIIIRKRKSH